jgi:hypothetical protein
MTSNNTGADLKLSMRSSIDSYRRLLDIHLGAGFSAITHAEWFVRPRREKTLLVRHDVDHDLERALKMAQVEAELGVHASYYLLPPGAYESLENYYGKIEGLEIKVSDRLKEVALQIQELGHEVGLHNDFVQLSYRLSRNPGDILAEQIGLLRSIGIRVVGTASHGSKFARNNDYINYELFTESLRKISSKKLTFDNGFAVELGSISYRAMGLVYEAYDLIADVRLTDSGGLFTCFNRSEKKGAENVPGLVDLEWVQLKLENANTATMLVHPEWWTPIDFEANLNIPLFRKKDRLPFRVLARGDCTSRRSIALNKDLFPDGVRVVVCGKSPNVLFADSVKGLSLTIDDLRQISNVDLMPKGLMHYYLDQADRSILDADGDLLVMDSYADMNFELWEDPSGRKFWIHPKFLRDPSSFYATNKKIGRRSLEEAVQDAINTILIVRKKNPNIPVLFLNQQVEFYRKLHSRMEFYDMGRRIASAVPGVFVGGSVPAEVLEPADVGSCGPEQTLHFSGATYRAMLQRALEAGIMGGSRDLKASSNISEGFDAVEVHNFQNTEKSNAELFIRRDASQLAVPRREHAATISLRIDQNVVDAQGKIDAVLKSFSNYFLFPQISSAVPRWTPCVIDLNELRDFESWELKIKKFEGGNKTRAKNKARRLGYFAKNFPWKLHIPDIYDVNVSMSHRSGGAMRGSYRRSIDEMGGAPDRHYSVTMPSDLIHWSITFGVFLPMEGHQQGDIIVNEKLVGYVSLRRVGDIACYSTILGHGEHLNNGAMILLHHEIAHWLGRIDNKYSNDLRYLMYGAVGSGGDGLRQWKKCGGFRGLLIDAFIDTLPDGCHQGRLFDIGDS